MMRPWWPLGVAHEPSRRPRVVGPLRGDAPVADIKYWMALIDFVSLTSRPDPDAPAGGVAWVVGAGAAKAAFKRLVASAPEFEGYRIVEWMELFELEAGYTSEELDGDAIVAELRRNQKSLFVDEIQWYMATSD